MTNYAIKSFTVLDAQLHGNFRMWCVATQFKVFQREIVNTLNFPLDVEGREGFGLPLQLHLEGLYVVRIDMSITKRMNELSYFQI